MCVVVSVAVMATACGDSPTAPSNTTTTTVTTPAGNSPFPLLLVNCGEVLDGYKCTSTYATSYNDQGREVTGLSTWSSSDTSIATVDSTGFVTVARAGNVAIRASYRDVEGFTTMQVEVGGFRRYYRDLSGWVTDSQDETKILNVDVRILDGPNAGRTANTATSGAYQFYGLDLGTFTVRFTRSGYMTLDRSYTLTGDKLNSLSVSMVKSSS
jgi:hypothetical protein